MDDIQKIVGGNPNLKGMNYEESISRADYNHRIQEIARCKLDIVYFANHYFHIINLDTGLGLIDLYPIQEELLRFMADEKRAIVLASRQTGKSTCYTIFVLWLCIFFPEKKVLIAANKSNTATELVGRIRLAYEHLPNWIKPGVTTWNKQEVEFTNLSSFKGASTSSDSARGTSCNVLILDEFSFIPFNVANAFFTSVYPIISSSKNSKVIIVSTPNGVGNLYHTLWEEANDKIKKSKDGWQPFRMDWWDVPNRDEEWKEIQIKSIGQERFNQEFGNSFLASSFKKLIQEETIEKLRIFQNDHKDTGLGVDISGTNKSFEFVRYHEYDNHRTYLMSSDVGEGVGSDSATAYVWDVTDMTNIIMCAKYSDSRTTPSELAYVLYKIALCYGSPFIAIESNGIGRSTLDMMFDVYQYENFVRMDKNNQIGIRSHVQIKSKACVWAQEFFTTPETNIIIYDEEMIKEMDAFIKKDTAVHTVYEAMKGKHDDHIISLIWALWVLCPDNVEHYFNVVEYMSTGIDRVLPKIMTSLFDDTPVVETNTQNILDIEWQKTKQEIQQQVDEAYRKEDLDKGDRFTRLLDHQGNVEADDSDLGFGFSLGGDCW